MRDLSRYTDGNLSLRLFVLAAWFAAGCAATSATYQVGPARLYQTVGNLPALMPGDIVEIDPATFNEVKRWREPGTATSPIIIRGVGAARPLFDATGKVVDGVLPNPRAVFQIEADYITVENLEFRNAQCQVAHGKKRDRIAPIRDPHVEDLSSKAFCKPDRNQVAPGLRCFGLGGARQPAEGRGVLASENSGRKRKMSPFWLSVRKGELPYDAQALKLAASLLIRAARCRDSKSGK